MVSFTYRWDDESNGEIYTERTLEVADDDDDTELTVNNDDNVTASSNPLYVVENGKEYRLVPLKQRRKLFEHLNDVDKSENAGKLKSPNFDDFEKVRHKKTSSDDKRESVANGITNSKEIKTTSLNNNGVMKNKDNKNIVDVDKEESVGKTDENVEKKDETVKSLNVPYIVEEQEILQNINIVKSVKNMFLKQNNANVNICP